ncbi:ribosomal protection-like ABC-F family protein [Aquibacillus kalidii]|uniref:ribosomal protection-like ABC-F family protein n=1 Tax=Aquibacillus kalidii TaxID=2762597 RepID=UPI0016471429|nr:ABC-F family ATP-binding cassette domain-containing protein [Aquibacillus kalidii]
MLLYMRANEIQYSIGDRTILDIANITIHQGDRIGLIGRNGQGKTSLIKALTNTLGEDFRVNWMGSWAHFEQLNRAEEGVDHYLSGGEKTITKLNKVLENKPDVLLLDEPTNNLDWKRVKALEKELANYKGSILIVSHDRHLLDAVCNKIWELEDTKITEFNGNYSFYEAEKELQRRQQYEAHETYLKEKNRLEATIRQKQNQAKGMLKPPSRMGNSEWQLHKNYAKAKQKKVQNVSKVIQRKVEQLEKVEKPIEWDQVKMDFRPLTPIHRKTILMAKRLRMQIQDRLLYNISSLKLRTGSKTAILGENGSGKTTLINQLLTDLEIDRAEQIKVAHFDQALEKLPENETVYAYVSKDSYLPQHIIRIILARLHLHGEAVNKRIGVLSGGERVKIAIAKLLVGDYNLLVLDEPTNHLDLDALKAVEGLIRDYQGTVLFVSHDRKFVQATATNLWILENKILDSFDGTVSEYEESLKVKKAPTDIGERILKLETKLTELLSRLSLSNPKDNKEELEAEYQRILKALQGLRKKLSI